MRNFFWLGTFLVVACAIGAYGMARYAAHNPSAAVTHCVNFARIGMGVVPTSDMHPKQTENNADPKGEQAGLGNDDAIECEVTRQAIVANQIPKQANPLATDPLEVIQIEQIDPKMAAVIAGAIGLEENLKQFKDAQPCEEKGLDQVVVQVMDENGVRECRGQERFPRNFMPYCEDEDCDASPCQLPGKIHCPVARPTHYLRMPTAEETEGLYMPYAEEQTPSTEVAEEHSEENSEPSEMQEEEMPTAEENLPLQKPSYHHQHQGCPYMHGHYCPYPNSSRPYYRQPMPESRDVEGQQERANPGTTNRISNWYDTNSPRLEGQNRGERRSIDWDRNDAIAFPQQLPRS